MRQFALIGKHLPHTFSPAYFGRKFKDAGITDTRYEAVELAHIGELPSFVQHTKGLRGFNVTIPYKSEIAAYIDHFEGDAAEISIVNTVRVEADASGKTKIDGFRLTGYNTDAAAFSAEIRPLLRPWIDRALILGDGASAQTVAHVLESIGIETMQVTRKPSADRIQYQQITPLLIQHHFLVVNTTPVGQFPNVDTKPNIPYEALTSKHLLFDLIYNPTETAFLAEGKKQGCMTQNGLGMLHLQAEKSWEIWNQA